jgi:hypothetical protein
MKKGKISDQKEFHRLCDDLIQYYIEWDELTGEGKTPGTPRSTVAGTDLYGKGVCLVMFKGNLEDLERIKKLLNEH